MALREITAKLLVKMPLFFFKFEIETWFLVYFVLPFQMLFFPVYDGSNFWSCIFTVIVQNKKEKNISILTIFMHK